MAVVDILLRPISAQQHHYWARQIALGGAVVQR